MNKKIKAEVEFGQRIGISPNEISRGHIIEYSAQNGERLVIDVREGRLKTVRWYKDSLSSRVAVETYDVFKTSKNQTLLYLTKYHRPNPSTSVHDRLVNKLEEAAIESPFD